MGHLSILGSRGDTRVTWNKDNADEVAKARAEFERLRKEGWSAFEIDPADAKKQGKRVDKFDASLGEIIMSAPLAGG